MVKPGEVICAWRYNKIELGAVSYVHRIMCWQYLFVIYFLDWKEDKLITVLKKMYDVGTYPTVLAGGLTGHTWQETGSFAVCHLTQKT